MSLSVRKALLAIAALAALTGLTACGSGGSNTTRSTSSTPAIGPRGVSAVNLRAGDLHGMVAVNGAGGSPPKFAASLRGCGIAIAGFEPGSKISALFRSGGSLPTEMIWSAVRLVPTAAIAAHDARADTSPQAQACAARVFAALYTERGPLVHKRTSASALAVPVPGGFGFRLVHRERLSNANPQSESSEGSQFRKLNRMRAFPNGIALDVLGFASGRLEVALVALRPADASAEKERRLLVRLYGRAKAA